MEDKNMLTTKEVVLLQDLLIYEENLAKKFMLYSRILTNPKLTERMAGLGMEHKQRFLQIFDLL